MFSKQISIKFVQIVQLSPKWAQAQAVTWRGIGSKPLPKQIMMTSSNGNIFRVTGHLSREFTGPRWIPRTKASDAGLWYFLCVWINDWVNNREAGDFWDAIDPLRRYCNDTGRSVQACSILHQTHTQLDEQWKMSYIDIALTTQQMQNIKQNEDKTYNHCTMRLVMRIMNKRTELQCSLQQGFLFLCQGYIYIYIHFWLNMFQ